MRHFDINRWLDYLRGFVPLTEMAAMEEHLSSNCGRCRRTVALLWELEEATRRDREYCVPAESVHLAKAAFALADSHKAAGMLSTMMARLVFDSFASPVPVGVRALLGAGQEQRRILYQAEDYCVDVSLQQAADSADVSLVGQVTSHQMPGQPPAGLAVELVSAEGRVASTVSNSQGEFCLNYLPSQDLHLCVAVKERSCIKMELSGLETIASSPQPTL